MGLFTFIAHFALLLSKGLHRSSISAYEQIIEAWEREKLLAQFTTKALDSKHLDLVFKVSPSSVNHVVGN